VLDIFSQKEAFYELCLQKLELSDENFNLWIEHWNAFKLSVLWELEIFYVIFVPFVLQLSEGYLNRSWKAFKILAPQYILISLNKSAYNHKCFQKASEGF
jgi:hypothetical protein